MSEKQLAGLKRRRSRAEVDELVAEFEASGSTRQDFCAKHGLSLVTLDRYRRSRQQRCKRPGGAGRFVRVELSDTKAAGSKEAGSELAVVLSSGRRLEVRQGFDADLLMRLVQVLERA
ncbi:MAG: IS66 family insertion sequence element accessory protein TnpA [Mycobacterium sp.]